MLRVTCLRSTIATDWMVSDLELRMIGYNPQMQGYSGPIYYYYLHSYKMYKRTNSQTRQTTKENNNGNIENTTKCKSGTE